MPKHVATTPQCLFLEQMIYGIGYLKLAVTAAAANAIARPAQKRTELVTLLPTMAFDFIDSLHLVSINLNASISQPRQLFAND